MSNTDQNLETPMTARSESFSAIALRCKDSAIGKRLPTALYVHTSAVPALDPLLQAYERQARVTDAIAGATLVKFSTDRPKISYLFYPDFDRDPHPVLTFSLVVDMTTRQVSEWDYTATDNPPILHRKETFVTPDYLLYETFAHLTRCEEALGLLENSRCIGTRQAWQRRLEAYRIEFSGHFLTCPLSQNRDRSLQIDRHKAAIARKTLSRPVRLALEAGLFTPDATTFFDYGCGYGSDVQHLSEQGYVSSGWDPYYHPEASPLPADIVNLGYVINVIEDLGERREALIEAWALTRQVLIVAAQILIDDRDRGIVAYSDGTITRRNTFQKYYEQEELKAYIDSVLSVDAIPAGLGVYFVFREETQAQSFRASRFHSRAKTPKIRAILRRFEDYQDLLAPLMAFFTERGRLPVKGELSSESAIKAEFGTLHRAFRVILQVSDREEWDAITEKRRQDLLLYLALSQFGDHPKLKDLSIAVRHDLKALFGGYQQACLLADMMLVSLRDLSKIADLCHTSPVGKKLKHSLFIHISALDTLPPLLRLYEGCASRTFSRLEEANVIQFSCRQPKITYLYYPDFDRDPHPSLHARMEVDLRDCQVRYQDFSDEDNPPILHEKDALVLPDYANYDKFFQLTQQEKAWGLLDNFKAISRLQGWLQCLEDHCATVRGYKVFWRKDADPYKVKLLQSQIKRRVRIQV
jgi:DNA phosphorothioation-associated putative methyltransferase